MFGRWINIVLCILCLTIIPAGSQAVQWREQLEYYLISETELLKYKIRQKGALTIEDYQQYRNIFEKLAGEYDFDIAVARSYVMPADETVLLAEDTASHHHTPDCFAGHNHEVSNCSAHEHSGNAATGGGCFTRPVYDTIYHYHTENCMKSYSSSGYINLPGSVNSGICGECGKTIWIARHSHPCGYCGEELGILVVKSCGCGHEVLSGNCGTHRHPPYQCGFREGEAVGSSPYPSGYEADCGLTEGWQCGLEGIEDASCNMVLCNIIPVMPEQVISPGERVNTEVIACWLNGEFSILEAETSFQETEAGSYTAILSLYGLCDSARTGVPGWKHCNVQVQLKEQNRVCSYGHSYSAEEEICPYCAMTVTGIEVRALRLYYQPGEELELEVILLYQDGSKKETGEWVSNFVSDQCGEQQVTVFCRGIREKVTVYVQEEGEVCTFCGQRIPEKEYVCPECYSAPASISAEGTAVYGSEPELRVMIFYRDGHYRLLEEGYVVRGFQQYKEGVQEIEILYQGLSCRVLLEIKAPVPPAEVIDNEEEYLSEPDPPALKLLYKKEIEAELEKNGLLSLENKNFLNISVEKRNVLSESSVILYRGVFEGDSFFYTNGGEIR